MAPLRYRRFSEPPTQRMPAPKITPELIVLLPCRKIPCELASSPLEVSTTVSGTVVPEAVSCAPAGLAQFAQPWPGSPKFRHGQSVVTSGSSPSPKQYIVPSPPPQTAPVRQAAMGAKAPKFIGPQPVTVSQPAPAFEAPWPEGRLPLLPDVTSNHTAGSPFMP